MERDEALLKHREAQKLPEDEPSTQENEDDYPRLVEALSNLPVHHAEHIRTLISMPGRPWKDYVPPMEDWKLCVIHPPEEPSISSNEMKKSEKEKKK